MSKLLVQLLVKRIRYLVFEWLFGPAKPSENNCLISSSSPQPKEGVGSIYKTHRGILSKV